VANLPKQISSAPQHQSQVINTAMSCSAAATVIYLYVGAHNGGTLEALIYANLWLASTKQLLSGDYS